MKLFKSNENARNREHDYRDEKCIWQVYQWTWQSCVKVSEFETRPTEISQIETQEKK